MTHSFVAVRLSASEIVDSDCISLKIVTSEKHYCFGLTGSTLSGRLTILLSYYGPKQHMKIGHLVFLTHPMLIKKTKIIQKFNGPNRLAIAEALNIERNVRAINLQSNLIDTQATRFYHINIKYVLVPHGEPCGDHT